MTPGQWNRLKELFQQAHDLPRESRFSWLEQQLGGDAELLAQAKALLTASDTLGGFLETPLELAPEDVSAVLAGSSVQPGDRIGAYGRSSARSAAAGWAWCTRRVTRIWGGWSR